MDTALEAYYAMREIVLRHPGGSASDSALAALRKLCHIAGRAAADAECAARLAEAEAHAELLFSGSACNGARRRILAELEHFRSRLHEMQKTKMKMGTYPI